MCSNYQTLKDADLLLERFGVLGAPPSASTTCGRATRAYSCADLRSTRLATTPCPSARP